jgi:uncharacterized protein YhaN
MMTTEEPKKEDTLPTAADGAAEEWDEARLTSAVERLQEMHIQVRLLYLTGSCEPLAIKH